ncbi:hypothetical protein B0H17DRAFT_1193894 [Mycena rosella]|uniref:Uncharacterized protein n=1 Tax=Mycena rosella TaxID=1033263 RepID=A0AAD7GRZ0_MYCRO|nr:hypothetical protein B0H17DRAFT_1193894 [Mycena rosella]
MRLVDAPRDAKKCRMTLDPSRTCAGAWRVHKSARLHTACTDFRASNPRLRERPAGAHLPSNLLIAISARCSVPEYRGRNILQIQVIHPQAAGTKSAHTVRTIVSAPSPDRTLRGGTPHERSSRADAVPAPLPSRERGASSDPAARTTAKSRLRIYTSHQCCAHVSPVS